MNGKRPLVPLYTDLTDRKVMVVGQGEEAGQMLRYLSAYTDYLYLLAEGKPDPEAQSISGVTVPGTDYERSLLYGMDYVISLSLDAAVNDDIHAVCRTLGIRVCIVREPGRSDFCLRPEETRSSEDISCRK